MSGHELQIFILLLLIVRTVRIYAECVNGDVRLRGGSAFEGRVEFCVNGQWGQVCAMGFTSDDAEVVCHQLGHDRINAIRATQTQNGPYGGENEVAVVTNVACTTSHNQLSQCSLQFLNGSGTCASSSGPAAVVCQDPECVANRDSVHLSEEQVVEVCAGGRYRTGVCSDNWDDIDATVVCRQLDEGEVGVANSTGSGFYRTQQAYQNVNCTGSEDTLSKCAHDLIATLNPIERCSSGQWARAICQGPTTTDATISSTANLPTTEGDQGTTMGPNQTTTKFPHTTEPNSTEPHSTEPGSEQPSGGNSVLAIVLGSVGGLTALLLIAILVVLIIGQRMKAVRQTSAIQEHGVGHGGTSLSDMEVNPAYSAVNRTSVAGTAEYEEIDDGQTAINGETDMFNIRANTAYQTRTEAAEEIVQAEEFSVKANECYQARERAH